MEVKVMGRSNTVAYKKIEKAMGNHVEPRNPLTTFQEETIIAILMISHRIKTADPYFNDQGSEATFDPYAHGYLVEDPRYVLNAKGVEGA
jgi:hypothetical protein